MTKRWIEFSLRGSYIGGVVKAGELGSVRLCLGGTGAPSEWGARFLGRAAEDEGTAVSRRAACSKKRSKDLAAQWAPRVVGEKQDAQPGL